MPIVYCLLYEQFQYFIIKISVTTYNIYLQINICNNFLCSIALCWVLGCGFHFIPSINDSPEKCHNANVGANIDVRFQVKVTTATFNVIISVSSVRANRSPGCSAGNALEVNAPVPLVGGEASGHPGSHLGSQLESETSL